MRVVPFGMDRPCLAESALPHSLENATEKTNKAARPKSGRRLRNLRPQFESGFVEDVPSHVFWDGMGTAQIESLLMRYRALTYYRYSLKMPTQRICSRVRADGLDREVTRCDSNLRC